MLRSLAMKVAAMMGWVRAGRFRLAWVAMLALGGGIAQAAPPAQWTATTWGPTSCSGCHSGSPPSSMTLGDWLRTDASFMNDLNAHRAAAGSSTMNNFYAQSAVSDHDAIRAYLQTFFKVGPVANAGSSQSVVTGTSVTLDGSASSVAAGDTLSYAWSLTDPNSQTVTLAAPSVAKPSFVATIKGNYVATLTVTDPNADGAKTNTATVTVTVVNSPPTANAGPAQQVATGVLVTLDGSASADPNHDPLTYAWTLTSRPTGSGASLSGAGTAHPTFTADLAGTYVASLVVNDGQVNSSAATVQVSASTPAPSFVISAATLDLATVAGTPKTGTLMVTNGGGANLTLAALSFGGANPGDYALDASNACSAGVSVVPGASCALVIRFAPAAAGTFNATLAITDNATGSPHSVVLKGTATAAPQGRLVLGATSLVFADTEVGSTVSQSISVQNTGDLALTFSAFTPGGANPADFNVGGSCSTATPLPTPGGQCTLTIRFQPSASAPRSGSLTIVSDASNGPVTIGLSGNGVAVPAPVATLSPTALDFGVQTVGGLFPPRTVQLSNTGNAALNVMGIAVSGAAFSSSTPATCPASLAPGASCTVTILYAASAAGASDAGALQVTSNAAGSPRTVALSGQGTAAMVPVLTWSPASSPVEFGTLAAANVSAIQTLTLFDQGIGGVTLSLVNVVGTNAANFAIVGGTCAAGVVLFGPSSGAPGGSCTVLLQFAPGTSGDMNAQVQVVSTGSAPPALALHGVGLAGPASGLGLSATALAFDATRVGAQSVPLALTLTSSASGTVRILGIDLTGPYGVQSTTCPAMPYTLQAGSSCAVSVAFSPQGEGVATGTLHVRSDAANAVADVALSGSGQAAASVSSGGCSLVGGDFVTDPALWLMAALAACALGYRAHLRRVAGWGKPGRRRWP